jgi:hypothetical protein
MNFRQSRTRWLLVSPAPVESEERHVWDLAFGLLCLENAGIQTADIELFVDGPAANYNHILPHATPNAYTLQDTSSLDARISAATGHENLVLIFTGHGSADGVAARHVIKPFPLAERVKNAPGLKFGVIVLGQCYAGIFNHINAKPKLGPDKKPLEAELVLIGATNLCESLSIPINETFLNGHRQSWKANIFLAMIFNWLRNPIDVDGDTKNTVMDAFKFAGARSNDQNRAAKTRGFTDVLKLYEDLTRINQIIGDQLVADNTGALALPTRGLQLLLQKSSIQRMIDDHVDIRLIHPEPWILNSWTAQDLHF